MPIFTTLKPLDIEMYPTFIVMANGEVRAYGTSQELISLTKTKSLEEAFINLTSGNKK